MHKVITIVEWCFAIVFILWFAQFVVTFVLALFGVAIGGLIQGVRKLIGKGHIDE